MKVLALTRTAAIGPSTRYRILQYRPALLEQDIEVVVAPLFGRTWFSLLELRIPLVQQILKAVYSLVRLGARVGQVLSAAKGDADVVLVEQQLFPYLPAFLEAALWPADKPTILEFDDAIFLTWAHEKKLRRLCALADVVIVGNTFLKEFAEQTARRVVVIPTTVDLFGYDAPERAPRPGRALRVAWIGLRYNLRYLQELAGPLARMAADGIDVELRVISSGLPEPGPEWAGVNVVARPWSEETEAEELAVCDVGVMPLPDGDWARGKCGLKLLQYMAAGIPVVASPVGVNREIVRHGENGLLAATEQEWEAALRRIAGDAELAARLAAEGRKTVEDQYSLESGARRVAETYRLAFSLREGMTAGGGELSHDD